MNYLTRIYNKNCSIYKNDTGSMFFLTFQPGLPEQLEPETGFSMEGTYIFCPSMEEPEEDFFFSLRQYVKRCPDRLLFLENPEGGYERFRCKGIRSLEQGGELKFGKYRLILLNGIKESCNGESLVLHGNYLFRTPKLICEDTGEDMVIPLFGERCGMIRFTVRAGAGPEVFSALDVGIKYAMPLDSMKPDSRKRGFTAVSCSRLLKTDQELILAGCITPHSMLDERKTYFELPKGEYDSSLSTETGKKIKLRTDGSVKLTFETTARNVYYDKQEKRKDANLEYYLGIAGTFIPSSDRILPGLSGTEFASKVNRITFIPHRNGFLSKDFPELTGGYAATAPWVCVNGEYCCAPKGALFYTRDEEKRFRQYGTPAAVFDGAMSPAAPFMFWNDALFHSEEEAKDMDMKIYECRYQRLSEVEQNKREAEQSVIAVTPQGLAAGFSKESGAINWLGIAQTGETKEPWPDIRLLKISMPFQKKFQDRDSFFVIENKEQFAQMASHSEHFYITIEGFRFLMTPESFSEETILIFKYSDRMSVKDFMKGSHVLSESLKTAYDGKGIIKEGYEDFVSIIDSRVFQGVLLLNGRVEMSGVGQDVRVIMNGVDQDKLNARYLAIRQSRIRQEGDEIFVEPSGVSALIDYQGDRIVHSSGSDAVDFQFKTIELKVVFENSRVKDFRSVSELLFNKLFLTSIQSKDPENGNCLIIDGRLQRSGNVQGYQFTQRSEITFEPAAGVIKWVVIDGVSLSSSLDGNQFMLSGRMAFEETEGCDIFAFGEENGGLRFERLKVFGNAENMSDDYSELSLLQNEAGIREGSLCRQFGGKVVQLLVQTQVETPDELGYLSITSPVKQGEVKAPWMGLVYRIELGSLGGLSGLEAVSMEFLAAWSVSEEGRVLYNTALKLPKLLSGEGFSFQGLLSIGFQSVELLKNRAGSFFFKLHNFSIKALAYEFPPGSADLYLFADQGKVGWYGAWVSEDEGVE